MTPGACWRACSHSTPSCCISPGAGISPSPGLAWALSLDPCPLHRYIEPRSLLCPTEYMYRHCPALLPHTHPPSFFFHPLFFPQSKPTASAPAAFSKRRRVGSRGTRRLVVAFTPSRKGRAESLGLVSLYIRISNGLCKIYVSCRPPRSTFLPLLDYSAVVGTEAAGYFVLLHRKRDGVRGWGLLGLCSAPGC